MAYQVKLTFYAIEQMQEAIWYISKSLLEPEIAGRWADFLKAEIASLSTMPARYPLTEQEPWRTKGIRKMRVKNFVVYYLIKENEKEVWVTAVVYGRSDQIRVLRDMPI